MPRIPALLLTLLPLLWLAAACGADRDILERPEGQVLKVTATTGQVGDMVRNIGGDRVQVKVLMGPGIDPHLYKASARDVDRLWGADLIVYNGLHLEAKMAEVLEKLDRYRPTLALGETLDPARLLSPSGFENAHDPHIWFDVDLWAGAIPSLVRRMSELAPEHAAVFREGGRRYAAQLDSLNSYAAARLGTIPPEQRVMITAHDAFNYFGRAYGLEVRGLQGISTMAEPGTRDVQDLARFIEQRRIPALFIETSVSPRAVNAVMEAVRARGFAVSLGGEIYSDALGDPDGDAGTYIGMVRHNVDVITAALRGEKADTHE